MHHPPTVLCTTRFFTSAVNNGEKEVDVEAMAVVGAIRDVVDEMVEVVEAVVMNGGDAVVTNGVVVMLLEPSRLDSE